MSLISTVRAPSVELSSSTLSLLVESSIGDGDGEGGGESSAVMLLGVGV